MEFSQIRLVFFFFQAEDGIRDLTVTGVQTCALPIFECRRAARRDLKSIKSAPGDSHHSDNAAAPGLRGQPRYNFDTIVLLLLCVLVRSEERRCRERV